MKEWRRNQDRVVVVVVVVVVQVCVSGPSGVCMYVVLLTIKLKSLIDGLIISKQVRGKIYLHSRRIQA
jgi:hypothetical protein